MKKLQTIILILILLVLSPELAHKLRGVIVPVLQWGLSQLQTPTNPAPRPDPLDFDQPDRSGKSTAARPSRSY